MYRICSSAAVLVMLGVSLGGLGNALAAQYAHAELITFDFVAEVTVIQDPTGQIVSSAFSPSLGDPIVGRYWFNSDATGFPSGPDVVFYSAAVPPSGMVFELAGTTFSTTLSSFFQINVFDNFNSVNGPLDKYLVFTDGDDLPDLSVGQIRIELEILGNLDAITNTDLPLVPPDLSKFEIRSFFIRLGSISLGNTFVLGRVISLTREAIVNVVIDIKPGSDPNSIRLSSSGVIPVAIISSPDFDATTVDGSTVFLSSAPVKLAGSGDDFLCHVEDVGGPDGEPDGLPDLVCQVETAGFVTEGSATAVLEAETFDGIPIRGEDDVKIIP